MSVREVCPEGDAYDRWLHQLTDDCPGCAEFARVHDPELDLALEPEPEPGDEGVDPIALLNVLAFVAVSWIAVMAVLLGAWLVTR
jgi:hypothetical protein